MTDNDLTVQHTYDSYHPEARLICGLVFNRRSCTFIPSRSTFKQGAIVVMLVQVDAKVDLVVAGANGNGIMVIGQCSLLNTKAVRLHYLPLVSYLTTIQGIVDGSCSESGFVSVLCE